jgi:hypothetical protein
MRTQIMNTRFFAPLFALSLFAPAAVASSHAATPSAVVRQVPPCDASLELLRAGRVEAPLTIASEERTALRTAETCSLDLADLRAGELTDHEWTLILIGAAIVLLIVLL